MISENDKIALVVCSNGKKIEDRARLEKLEVVLKEMSLVPVFVPMSTKRNSEEVL